MAGRKYVNRRRDYIVFRKTAARTKKANIPGRVNPRGGDCL